MSNKNSLQDKRELDKYIKFLAIKTAQVIVQSRLGEKIKTPSNPVASGNHWFNIAINDQADVLNEAKKILALNPGETITSKLPLCVEISLKTVEGDTMILEVWSLGIQTEQTDPSVRASHPIYNGMGILLKSLIAITRATPAYKLARKQSSDSYNIYYRIYNTEPHTSNLGEGFRQIRVGQLCTTVGTLNMAVAFRTKMTISPTQTGRDNTMMLKSDHFLKDLSPKHIRYHNIKKNEKKVIDLDKPLKPGAFADVSKLKQYTEEDYILPETPPFNWLLRKTKEDAQIETSQSEEDIQSNLGTSPQRFPPHKSPVNNNNTTTTATATTTTTLPKNIETTLNAREPSPASMLGSRKSSLASRLSVNEPDELLKELHFPFATANTPINDLAKFYRDCFNAPPLQEFTETPIEEEDVSVDDLSKQLEQFETSLGDYDSLVTSLCCQSVDNNSNS